MTSPMPAAAAASMAAWTSRKGVSRSARTRSLSGPPSPGEALEFAGKGVALDRQAVEEVRPGGLDGEGEATREVARDLARFGAGELDLDAIAGLGKGADAHEEDQQQKHHVDHGGHLGAGLAAAPAASLLAGPHVTMGWASRPRR